jgi:hypothetical protein
MNLSEISWPVFRLTERPPEVEGPVTYYVTESLDQDSNTLRKRIRLVDDRTVPGDYIGTRRLAMKASGAPMYSIRKAIYFLGDLIKLSKSTTWFIDNTGKVFQYQKTTRAKLTCHRVTKLMPAKGMGVVVEVQGIPTRFKALYAPLEGQIYAGILHNGLGSILYGFYYEPFKPSTRLV